MTETKRLQPESSAQLSRLNHPYVILLVSIFLPGVGQVMNNTPGRGLLMVCFMIMLGMATFYTTTPDHSVLGRFAGGIFIYAISVLDAYRWARYRWEIFRKPATK